MIKKINQIGLKLEMLKHMEVDQMRMNFLIQELIKIKALRH